MARSPAWRSSALVFGVTLSGRGMSDPDVIRGALLFQEAYLFLFFASAVLDAIDRRAAAAAGGRARC